MEKTYSLSAVILSKNSQSKISDCIDSLLGWADEIIVVDGLSEDRTVELVKNKGAIVYSHRFLGSFAQERNFGTAQAHGDWVLQLDSDEVVTKELKGQCDLLLPKTKLSAFKFLRKNFFLGAWI